MVTIGWMVVQYYLSWGYKNDTIWGSLWLETPLIISYHLGASKLQVVDTLLQIRNFTLVTLKDNIVMAQNRMKKQVCQHLSEQVFKTSD